MKTVFSGLVVICLTSCFPIYTKYTYETDEKIKSIDNNIDTYVNIFPQSNKYGILKQVASGPYLITVSVGENLDLLNYIEVDSMFLVINNDKTNILEKDFKIYDSGLERNYSEKEKDEFLSDRKIIPRSARKYDYIVFIFEDVEIIYHAVPVFELVINVKLDYKNAPAVSKEIIYKFIRKRNTEIVTPSA